MKPLTEADIRRIVREEAALSIKSQMSHYLLQIIRQSEVEIASSESSPAPAVPFNDIYSCRKPGCDGDCGPSICKYMLINGKSPDFIQD